MERTKRAVFVGAAVTTLFFWAGSAAADDGSLRLRSALLDDAAMAALPRASATSADSPFPAPVAEPNPWSVGLRTGYTTIPNAILGALLTQYMPVNGWFIEGVAGRRMKGFTLYLSLSGTLVGSDRGIWQRGPTKTPNDVSLSLGLLAADALFDWEVRLHKRFAFHFGAGLGIGILFGTINSIECTNATAIGINQCSLPGTTPPVRDRKAEDSWPVYPILHLVAGAHIDLIDKLALRIDFDFRNAFGLGIGLFYQL